MSNTKHAEEKIQFANYCGQPVTVLEVESSPYGTLAFIQFEDGKEDQVPLARVDFVK